MRLDLSQPSLSRAEVASGAKTVSVLGLEVKLYQLTHSELDRGFCLWSVYVVGIMPSK